MPDLQEMDRLATSVRLTLGSMLPAHTGYVIVLFGAAEPGDIRTVNIVMDSTLNPANTSKILRGALEKSEASEKVGHA